MRNRTNRIILRTAASFIILSLFIPYMTSCSKSEDTNTVPLNQTVYYPDDALYYEETVYQYDKSFLEDYIWTGMLPKLVSEDSVIMEAMAFDESMDYASADRYLIKYDFEGNMISYIREKDESSLDSLFEVGGDIYTVFTEYDTSGLNERHILKCDFDKGEAVEDNDLKLPSSLNDYTNIVNVFSYKDSTIWFLNNWYSASNSEKGFYIVMIGPDGKEKRTDIDIDFLWVNGSVLIDDDIVFAGPPNGIDSGEEIYYYILNIESGDLKKTDVPFDMYSSISAPGTGSVSLDEAVLSSVDPVTGKEIMCIDLSYSDFNRDTSLDGIYRLNEDEIIFNSMAPYANSNMESEIHKLTLVKDNPCKGRKLVRCAGIATAEYQEYMAINEFNRTSKDYFMIYDDQYEWSKYRDDEMRQTDYYGAELIAYTEASDRVMDDIRAGNGPDILLLGKYSSSFDTDSYLSDISDVLGSQDEDELFITYSSSEGPLYRIPYLISFSGLLVKKECLEDENDHGMTYEQYDVIVKDHNDGFDPLSGSDELRENSMYEMFTAQSEFFYDSEGKVSIDNDRFRDMASFLYNRPAVTGSGREYMPAMTSCNHALMQNMYIYFLNNYDRYSLTGFPSGNDLPGTLNPSKTVSITACCAYKDDMKAFADIMLSYDVLSFETAFCEGDPVNIRAFTDLNKARINRLNNDPGCSYTYLGEGELLDPDLVDYMAGQCRTCTYVDNDDNDVITILKEEMASYFDGSKSVDDVIKVVQSRANTKISERE